MSGEVRNAPQGDVVGGQNKLPPEEEERPLGSTSLSGDFLKKTKRSGNYAGVGLTRKKV